MKDKLLYIILGSCFVVLVVLKYMQPKPIDWSPSFSKTMKIPYGNFVLFERLSDIFPNKKINISKGTLRNYFKESKAGSPSNLIVVNDNVSFLPLDEKELLNFVAEGNWAFIASNNLPHTLLDTLEVLPSAVLPQKKDTSSIVINGVNGKYKDFGFNRSFLGYFNKFNSNTTEVIGWLNGDQAVMLKVRFGNGYFILSKTPFAFTNYHMLTNDNHKFVSYVLSHLPLNNCIWDEYYKTGKKEEVSKSPLRAILASFPLKMAYYLVFFSLLIFMVFKFKRIQKMIPLLSPNLNTSLDFIRTVGQLYHQKADHNLLIQKKQTFFLAEIREKFGLPTHDIDKEFIRKLAALSGIDPKKVEQLFGYFNALIKKERNTDQDLIKLNNLISEFHKTSKR